MTSFDEYFNWPDVNIAHFYIYFVLTAILAFYMTYKSGSKYKFELFFIAFYLLTGNLNELLTIRIPGFSLFEIWPERFLFFLLSFFIIRKTVLSRKKLLFTLDKKVAWFEIALFGYVIMLVASQIVNIDNIGLVEAIKVMLETLAFLAIMIGLKLFMDKPSYNLVGQVLIVGAVISSLVSFAQLVIDPYFLRIGDDRAAFGTLLRSNGIFNTEYFNSYYLIIAIAWTFTTIKKKWLKTFLILIFSLGVLTTFHRMSWLILALVSIIYLVYINRVAYEKILVIGLSALALLLSLSIFYYQDIMNSSLVKERLNEPITGRKAYYSLVLDNIDKKPLFGYGNFDNEVYYAGMLQITSSRQRASGETGGLHSGYFSTLFLYGVPAFVFFSLFALLSVMYYASYYRENIYFAIPLLVSVIYLIGNLTNTFLFLSYLSVLFAVHIGIGMGINGIDKGELKKAG
ncbi:O-antigen ligase family protein [Maribacter algicola]|uniref:O-antigen ligase family protein n=1 Tax=Meishania litoralis TaxID=3434685 RepID=A0ACC7LK40_9FLAO